MATGEIVVRVLASISALYMCFSPAPTMYRIHTRKAVECMPFLPLVSQWSYNHTWMLYGYAAREYFPLLVTYAVGSVLSGVFLAVYYSNSGDQRHQVLKLVACTLVFNIATTTYTIVGSAIQSTSHVSQTIGTCAILCGFLLYASPFATIVDVVRTKSAASMPIAMVSVGALSNAVWIIYGFLQHDIVIIIPTVVNTGFCVLQLILYAVYHPNRRSLKAALLGFHCRLPVAARRANSSANAHPEDSEHDMSFVQLETPRYEEQSVQIAA